MKIRCKDLPLLFLGIIHLLRRSKYAKCKAALALYHKLWYNLLRGDKRIKHRRLELGYTLLYVAEQLQIKEATMQRYESGAIKNIKHETITKLAQILKCDPSYLMGWTDTPIKIEDEFIKHVKT